MRLRVLLLAFISVTLAQERNSQRSARAPQAQIKYHDPNGLKVDWKLFAPQNQWRSHLQNSRQLQQEEPPRSRQSPPNQGSPQSRLVHLETDQLQHRSYSQQHVQSEPRPDHDHLQYKTLAQPGTTEVQQNANQVQYRDYALPRIPVDEQSDPNQIQYSKYTGVPAHVKLVIQENFKPQHPYVDPSGFLYSQNSADPQQFERQAPTAESGQYGQPSATYEQIEQEKIRREYADERSQGRIVYKEEPDRLLQQQQQESQVEHVPVPVERLPPQPPQTLLLDKNMPSELQQLLHYQAQIPYDVIANSITFKPKTLFVPKLLSSETKGPYHYRSKVYYVHNDEYQPDFETVKPVEEKEKQ